MTKTIKNEVGIFVIGSDHHNILGIIRNIGEVKLYPETIIVTNNNESFVSKRKYIRDRIFVKKNEQKIILCS